MILIIIIISLGQMLLLNIVQTHHVAHTHASTHPPPSPFRLSLSDGLVRPTMTKLMRPFRLRLMSQTVRIDCKHFLSRVRVSVRTSNFVYAKNTNNSREPCRLRECLFKWPAIMIASDSSKRALTPSLLGKATQ